MRSRAACTTCVCKASVRAELQRLRARLWIVLSVGSVAIASASATEPDAIEPQRFSEALSRADRLFVAGDLEGALRVLEPVCAHTERAECSFSLGAIEHGLGHCREALAHYRRYGQQEPAGEHAAEVAAALEEVENRCGDEHASASVQAPPSVTAVPPPLAIARPGPVNAAVPDASPQTPPPALAHTELVVGSFALAGAAAVSSVVFGILAARGAQRCERARAYDRDFIEDCEIDGPRHQRLWQGLALTSGGFLGIGLTIWWLDARSAAALGVTQAGHPTLQFQGRF